MTTTTTNYGFVKPDVGASDDVWGGLLNTDLDSIDAIVKTVSNTAMGDNRLINGDMRIDQRNNGASGNGANNAYVVDRWYAQNTPVNHLTWGRNLNAVQSAVGFPYYLGVQSSAAYTAAAGDIFQVIQAVEADAVSDFAWGTANAQLVTLSFWALSSLTGTFSGSIRNYATTRSYPFTFSLPAANTWTKIVITIPGDTGGTWVMSGNGGALFLTFDLGSGSTSRGAAGTWASASYTGATGAVNLVATLNATFYVTGVKLEVGSVATPYNRQSLAKSMADCQRYYWDAANGGSSGVIQVSAYGATGGGAGYFGSVKLPVTMRATPTVTPRNLTYTNCSAISSGSLCPDFMYVQATMTAPGAGIITFNASLSAEL